MAMRAYLSDTEKAAFFRAQGWRCGCGCGAPVYPGSPHQWDHTRPVGLYDEADARKVKPDACLTTWCHTEKTKLDRSRIDKARRQGRKHRGEAKRKGRKLELRGFTGWRKFNGELVTRNG